MEDSFEKIMSIEDEKDGKPYCPFYLNHVREQCYGRCWDGIPIDEYELCVHVEGKTTLYVGEQVYYPKRGTVAAYKSGELHKEFVTGLEPYERYILWFDFDYVRQMFRGADESLLAMFTKREMFQDNVLQLPPHQTGRLLKTLERAAEYSADPTPESKGYFLAACVKALAIVAESYNTAVSRQESGNYSPIVSMALEIIEKHYVELQSVEELANRLNISNSYLARMFKKQAGTPVYEYIQNMKLSHAVKLLTEGKNVTQVCFEAGFNNYSYFIQLFKRKYGITPHKYQKGLES